MGRVTVILNLNGVREMLNSDGVKNLVTEHASEVKKRANSIACREGAVYADAEPHKTGQRWAANVYPENSQAHYDNLEHNTLLKAVGGGAHD